MGQWGTNCIWLQLHDVKMFRTLQSVLMLEKDTLVAFMGHWAQWTHALSHPILEHTHTGMHNVAYANT